ncbi:hypothetical protein OTU49_011740 [Cherax quadricarinatus]|uniref:Uncharacterized protein n=2 Tax=Cherax quadricarinatus TaxID=27406 RepID=A0AAW0W257_CHEQU|nr:uncharacterized protein LOC128697257 isoform X2 [Cherax quadricarinatus]XP_053644862.1 uncharacterized protein LOC128697257 isoform X2 [Cherax quadricarinatus]
MSKEDASEDLESLKRQQAETRFKLNLANRHISTLYTQVQDLEVQFKTAIKHKKHSARYNLRQKLAVIMGLKIVYLNYCSVKSQELERINQKLQSFTGREEEAMDTDSNEEPNLAILEM